MDQNQSSITSILGDKVNNEDSSFSNEEQVAYGSENKDAIVRGDNAEVPVSIEHIKLLGRGYEGEAFLSNVTVKETGRRLLMVHKVLISQEGKSKFVEICRTMREAGLDVLDNFWIVDDGLLMDDLTNNGANTVISLNDVNMPSYRGMISSNPVGLELFRSIDLDAIEQFYLENQIELANKQGIHFQFPDSWFIVVEPSGSARIVPVDCQYIEYVPGVAGMSELGNLNKRNFSQFIDRLRIMQRGEFPLELIENRDA